MTPAEREARETAWRIHAAVGEWTARVDIKASFALTLESAALAGIVALSEKGRLLDTDGAVSRALMWLGVVLILAGALCAVSVIAPRLRADKVRAEATDNFVYFGHLQHWDPVQLAQALKDRDVLPVLSRQLVVTSAIAWRKHRMVQLSFASATVGALVVFLSGLLA